MTANGNPMRFGLVGAGCIGQLRAAALAQVPGCRLVAVSDVDTARAASIAPPGAKVFKTPSELLAHDGLDAVIISTPPQFHEEIACAALRGGRHVICEKPLASSVEAAKRMVEAARAAGRVLTTGFNHRYFPIIKHLKSVLDSGEIGELDHVRAYAGHPGLTEFRAPWEYDKKVMGGGALMDVGIHLIDLTNYIMGGVDEVFGHATHHVWKLGESEDNGYALLRNRQGRHAILQASWTEWKGYRFHVEAYGTCGMVRAYYAPMMNLVIRGAGQTGVKRTRQFKFHPGVAVREKLFGWQSTVRLTFAEEFRDFLELCAGRKGTIAEGFDGFRAVEIAHAVYQSTHEGKAVRLTVPF